MFTQPIFLSASSLALFPERDLQVAVRPNRKSTFSRSLSVWMHKATAAAMGNLGCKSMDGDPIKRALDLQDEEAEWATHH